MNARQWVESLRIVNSMSFECFKLCFGVNDAPYLWHKFTVSKNSNVFDFISYLDLENANKLYNYCLNKMRN